MVKRSIGDNSSCDATGHKTRSQLPRPEHNLGKIINNRIQLTGLIGTGEYGTVYSAVDIYSREKLAVKALPRQLSAIGANGPSTKRRRVASSQDERYIDADYASFDKVTAFSNLYPTDRAYREAALHLRVHGHPNILSILEILESVQYLFLVLDYYPRGDLFHCITDLRWYVGDDTSARAIFSQLADAVTFCHKNGVYHCDLKPENVLVSDDGSTIRLADFGLATTQMLSSDFGCGSTFYMSPERISHSGEQARVGAYFSTIAADVWALGVILLNLTCGRNPWRKASKFDDNSYKAFLRDSHFLQRILPVSSDLNAILLRVFTPSARTRISPESLHWLVVTCKHLTVTNQPPVPSNVAAPPTVTPVTTASYHKTPVIGASVLPPTPIASPLSTSDDSLPSTKQNILPPTQTKTIPTQSTTSPKALDSRALGSASPSLSPTSPLTGLGLLPAPKFNSGAVLPPISTLDLSSNAYMRTPRTSPIHGSHSFPPAPTHSRQPITTDQLPLTPILS
ncbi:putative serine/threonine protein kinase VHS1 [Sugiyamaella lignohabitans]|uniref:Putative serine/threonine protein kinase VHS1 n=1 Tax=Sugiyamaella lignohabitans TaxID=796027 RepID=A0A167FCD8_9ASCO|nr:putative serine/threonine protein kinase VHS1 [Sugiyamaella lignohabitans]ANB15113.1 putative serine/threonine protein kinase VHS1 [Sugiyamaella lignohabitans]